MNRVLILVNITGLIIGISYGLHGPILPIFAKNVIGASYSELGLIGLANFIPYMFIPVFVGILLDKFNNGYLLAIGVSINSASIYLLSIAHSVPEIMGFRIMTGVAHAFFWPPCESIISNESTEKTRVIQISPDFALQTLVYEHGASNPALRNGRVYVDTICHTTVGLQNVVKS